MVTDSHQHADGKVHAHLTPVRIYWAIFFALIFFTLLTVGVSYVHLGPLNLVVAIVIATAKAALVVLYFMHMKYEAKFNVLVFLASLLFMGIFLAYTMNDTEYRGSVDYAYGGRVDPRTGAYAHGTPAGLVAQMEGRAEREAEAARQTRELLGGYEAPMADDAPAAPVVDEEGEGEEPEAPDQEAAAPDDTDDVDGADEAEDDSGEPTASPDADE
jgi:cytochrome c oxidase subunit IV